MEKTVEPGTKGTTKEIWKYRKILFCWNTIILAHIPKFWSIMDILCTSSSGIQLEHLQICRLFSYYSWFEVLYSISYLLFNLLLQAMVIAAWKGVSPLEIFQKDVLYSLSSIFITAAVLRLLQSKVFSFNSFDT